MSQLQSLEVEKMKYKRDGGGYRCDQRNAIYPSFATWLYNQIKAFEAKLLFYAGHTIECQERNDDMTIKIPGFPES